MPKQHIHNVTEKQLADGFYDLRQMCVEMQQQLRTLSICFEDEEASNFAPAIPILATLHGHIVKLEQRNFEPLNESRKATRKASINAALSLLEGADEMLKLANAADDEPDTDPMPMFQMTTRALISNLRNYITHPTSQTADDA